MNITDILARCDHTLLLQTATWEEIRAICDDGMKYKTASVCIPPCYVKQAKEYVGDRLAVCTVIGFPNGDSTTAVKCFEAECTKNPFEIRKRNIPPPQKRAWKKTEASYAPRWIRSHRRSMPPIAFRRSDRRENVKTCPMRLP